MGFGKRNYPHKKRSFSIDQLKAAVADLEANPIKEPHEEQACRERKCKCSNSVCRYEREFTPVAPTLEVED